jgi:hypothetical protein
MAAKKEQEMIIKINRPQITKANITIVGETPLIVHAWGEKAKKEMLDAQQKKKVDKKAKEIRDPFAEFMDALYWITPKPEEKTPEAFEKAVMEGAKFGFPITAIKQAALSACYRAGIIPNQMGMKCTFYLNAKEGLNPGTGSELAVIDTDEPPVFREDMVKIGGMTKVADLRYRPAFTNWKIRIQISLIEVGTFNMESIINAIDMGGFMNGIGEWRMERDGEFGRFHVEVEE